MTDDARHPLLEVQRLDITLDQIRHRRETLPEAAAVAEADATSRALDRREVEVRKGRVTLERRQAELETELAALEAKITKLDTTLYGGGITSPKDALLAQEELAHLADKQSALEDDILAVLDELSPSDDELAAIGVERDTVAVRRAQALAALDVRHGELDTERASVLAERETVVVDLAAEMVADYESRRNELGSSTVVVFSNGRCVGCPSAMPAVEIDRVRHLPSGSCTTCGECGRIVLT